MCKDVVFVWKVIDATQLRVQLDAPINQLFRADTLLAFLQLHDKRNKQFTNLNPTSLYFSSIIPHWLH